MYQELYQQRNGEFVMAKVDYATLKKRWFHETEAEK